MDLATLARRRGSLDPPFRARIQTIRRHYAAPLSHPEASRTRQDLLGNTDLSLSEICTCRGVFGPKPPLARHFRQMLGSRPDSSGGAALEWSRLHRRTVRWIIGNPLIAITMLPPRSLCWRPRLDRGRESSAAIRDLRPAAKSRSIRSPRRRERRCVTTGSPGAQASVN